MLCFLTNQTEELVECAENLKRLKGKLTLRERAYCIAGKNPVMAYPLMVYHNLYHHLRSH